MKAEGLGVQVVEKIERVAILDRGRYSTRPKLSASKNKENQQGNFAEIFQKALYKL